MNVLEFLGVAWILSAVALAVFAVAAAVQGWRRRRAGNTLGHVDRYRVDPEVRGLVGRMREQEPDL